MTAHLDLGDGKISNALPKKIQDLKRQGRTASEIAIFLNLQEAKIEQLFKIFKISTSLVGSSRGTCP